MKNVLLAVFIISAVMTAACAHESDVTPQPAAHAGAPSLSGEDLSRINPMILSPINAVRVPHTSFLTRLQGELKLTDDQHAKVHTAWDAYVARSNEVLKHSQEAAKALNDALRVTPVDEKAMKEALEKSLKAEEELATVCIDYWVDYRSCLTPEQDKKLTELIRPGPSPVAANNTKATSTTSAPEKSADK